MTENITESNISAEPESNALLTIPVDLHIEAISSKEAEGIAGLLAGFERTQDVAVGIGIAKGTFRVRGTLKLTGPLDPKLLADIQVVGEMSAIQNQFLDAGWEPSGRNRLALSFSRAVRPLRQVGAKGSENTDPSEEKCTGLFNWLEQVWKVLTGLGSR